MNKNNWFSVLKHLSWLTQLGVSMATPPVLALLLAYWLTHQFGVGAWVYVPAIVLGIGAGGMSFWQFSRILQGHAGHPGKQTPTQGANGQEKTPRDSAENGR